MTQTSTQDSAALTGSLYNAAAEALTASLPVTVALTARHATPGASAAQLMGSGSLVAAGYVGEASADLALSLDPEVLGESGALDPNMVSLEDVLRPALEAATGVLGAGVLSSTGPEAAGSVLGDAAAAFYRLESAGRMLGWFAIRLRDPGAAETVTGADVHPAALTRSGEPDDVTSRLNRLRNVHMGLTVEIGRARVSVRDVLDLEVGAVIELDRNAGAPADVRLNGRLVAQGEVVVMDQEYGVRITRILDSAEGLQ